MYPRAILSLCLGATLLFQNAAKAEENSITIKPFPPVGGFSENRPKYLHFEKVTVTRLGSQRLGFDVTLLDSIPTNLKESVRFYFAFDIDQDATTGVTGINVPSFGRDISFSISQRKDETRFTASSGSVEFKGRAREISISNLKVRGNTMSFTARSELFSMFDSFSFFASASVVIYEKDKLVNSTQVNTTPVTTLALAGK